MVRTSGTSGENDTSACGWAGGWVHTRSPADLGKAVGVPVYFDVTGCELAGVVRRVHGRGTGRHGAAVVTPCDAIAKPRLRSRDPALILTPQMKPCDYLALLLFT
jgi:hypothetical protein